MNNKQVSALVLVTALWGGVACGESSSTSVPVPASAPTDTISLEDALANIDTGRDVGAARSVVEAKLAKGDLPADARARAAMTLARAALAEGDRERGIKLLEEAIVLGDTKAEKQLFAVLSGHEPPSAWARRSLEEVAVAPFAQALAKYFPPPSGERGLEIDVVAIGGTGSRAGDALGTFAVDEVARQAAQERCGFCDEPKTNVHMTSSRETSWSAIPRYAPRFDKALVVVYVDRDTVVPERYAHWLALPVAEVRAAIDNEQGLYAVKERPSAPPLVTIVAPRPSQFLTVEAALAARSDIPSEPTSVKLAGGLAPREIQNVVRNRFGVFRKCYETLLTTHKTAAGRAVASFSIAGKGDVRDARVELGGSLEEPEMRACFVRGLESLRFPQHAKDPNEKITVVYPVELRP